MRAEVGRRFGQNLRRVRRRAGLSQEGLARRCSLHRTEVSYIERARRTPRIDTLVKLATALEAPVDELLEGIEWALPAENRDGRLVVAEG